MAQGDAFDVNDGDEIELTFQLNIKQVEVKKRRDASQLTHVKIQFITDLPSANSPGLAGTVHVSALDADVRGDPEKEQVIPITQDDQKFIRLYRVGPIEMFDKAVNPLLTRAAPPAGGFGKKVANQGFGRI